MTDPLTHPRLAFTAFRSKRTQYWLGLIFVAVAALFIALSHAQVSYAADEADTTQITMSPTSTRLELTPGSSQTGKFTVVNSGKKAYTFKVYAAPYSIADSAYSQPDFTHPSDRTRISSWISFEKDSYLLGAGETLTVPFTVNAPNDVPNGGQYGVIFAETEGEIDTRSGNAVVSKKRVGMVLYAQLPGTTRSSGNVEAFTTSWLQMAQPPVFRHTVENNGNTHFDATVKYVVEDLNGKEVAKNEITSVVLPETSREIELTWNNAPPIGLYNVSRTVSFLETTQTTKQLVLRATPLAGLIILAVVICGVGGAGYAIYRARSSRRHTL